MPPRRRRRRPSSLLQPTIRPVTICGCPGASLRLQNPNTTDKGGRTALHDAAGLAWPEMVELLLTHGCPPNVRDRSGATAMAAAAAEAARAVDEDVLAVMKLLHRFGADLEAPDAEGLLPLAYAASWAGDKGEGQPREESLVALKFLLDRGAEIDAVAKVDAVDAAQRRGDGASALMVAVDEVRWSGLVAVLCGLWKRAFLRVCEHVGRTWLQLTRRAGRPTGL